MLRLIAYDIAEPKRWRRVHEVCEDFGVRVQYSLFECWLEEDRFQLLWARLHSLIEPKEDRLAAYTLDAAGARRRVFAGETMLGTQPVTCYIV
jgi:CRISPR-associated protein Cas2